jgi:hypothetical protein
MAAAIQLRHSFELKLVAVMALHAEAAHIGGPARHNYWQTCELPRAYLSVSRGYDGDGHACFPSLEAIVTGCVGTEAALLTQRGGRRFARPKGQRGQRFQFWLCL